jgi:hypothetical protein
MGSGKFSDLMKTWATKECEQAGLGAELKQMQLDKLKQLRKNLKNVLGDDAMQFLDEGIAKGVAAIHIAKKL